MQITGEFLALIPVVVGIVQVLKTTKFLAQRFVPLASLVVGVLLAVALGGFDVNALLQGIIVAFSACGLWSGGKTSYESVRVAMNK